MSKLAAAFKRLTVVVQNIGRSLRLDCYQVQDRAHLHTTGGILAHDAMIGSLLLPRHVAVLLQLHSENKKDENGNCGLTMGSLNIGTI